MQPILTIIFLTATQSSSEADQIRADLQARESVFESVRLKMTYRGRYRVARKGPFREQIQALDLIWDLANKRSRLELVEGPPGEFDPSVPAGGKSWWKLTSIDPEETRELARTITIEQPGSAPAAYTGHHVRISRLGAHFWAVQPSMLLYLEEWSPNKLVEGATIQVMGRETVDGHEAILVSFEHPPRGSMGAGIRGRYWIAPGLGHAVVKSEYDRRPTPDAAWKLIDRTLSSGFRMIGESWIPATVQVEISSYHDDGGYELTRELTATIEEFAFDPPIAPDTFRLTIPDNASVDDYIRNIHYVKGGVGDPDVRRGVAKARLLAGRSHDGPGPSHELGQRFIDASRAGVPRRWAARTWVAMAVSTLLILIVAGAFFRSRARHGRPPVAG